MNYSYNWLQELLPGLKLGAVELSQEITMRTAECEGVRIIQELAETDGAVSGLAGTVRMAESFTDSIIEINNKSLTNRPDLWGHLGMAREVAAISGIAAIDLVRVNRAILSPEKISIDITNPEICPRYTAALIEDVQIHPSPLWLRSRLHGLGLPSINNVVDVTNYVMMELGQPMHAFDADLLGSSIVVRHARENERLAALNGEAYIFTPDDILIATPDRAVAAAGIIGGADTAIGDKTTRVLFESACFPAAAIRKTSTRIKLRTDASMRFEKGQDPENTMRAISRVLELLEKISADAKPISIADKYPRRIVCPRLLLDLDWAERKLGRNLATKTVADLFTSLSFQVETLSPRSLAVTVPSWRATKDISIPEDLVEEIGRMLGYASINPTPPAVLISPPRTNSRREQSKHVRAVFISQGLTEVQNYSFIPDSALPVFGYDPSTLLEIANPIASDQRYLRPSLIPGMWKVVVENTRYFGEGRLFEIGKQYVRGLGGLISERTHLVAAIFGSETDGTNLLELKRVVHCMSPELVGFPAEGLLPYEHPERTATLKFGSVPVGRIFEIHPVLFERGRAAFVDIDLDQLRELPMAETVYQPLRRFPISSFDLSVIADARELVGVIDATIRNLAGDDLVSLQFLQVFVLPEDRKSLSFRLVIGSRSHTLTSEEVAAIRNRIVAGLQSEGYELRR